MGRSGEKNLPRGDMEDGGGIKNLHHWRQSYYFLHRLTVGVAAVEIG